MKETKSPLNIYNPGDKHGEYFNLNSSYMLTLEECVESTHDLYHSMIAPGYFQGHNWSLHNVYTPTLRPLHRHDSLELMYVVKGEMVQYIEDFQRVYTKGECCILNKNIRHVESFSSDFEAVFLLLSDEFILHSIDEDYYFKTDLNQYTNNNPVYKELRNLLKDSSAFQKKYLDFIPLADKSTQNKVEQLFGEMILETRMQNPGFYHIVSGNFARLLSLLADPSNYQLHIVDLKNSNEDYVFNRINIYLEKNNGRVDYDELEKLMHYTRDYLNRIIKRRSGMTLIEFGQKICLEKAASLLITTDKSISQIIQELNYTNRTYFYRIFEKKYGTTPIQYRKNNQTKK